MIVFEKIRWKNFLSTGNHFTEIDFLESTGNLILGCNGAGKSTMLDALCFTLFNKPFRKIIKAQLVNSINEKEMRAEVEFKIGSVSYKVIRGMKPAIFEIHRNGSLLDQDAANKDYQKYLEQSILKFNYKSFTQVVILGSSTFVPFMKLNAPNRREVIEDILDIQIFSRMNVLLKDRSKDIRDEMKVCAHEVTLAEQKVELQRKSIGNLEKMNADYLEKLQDRFTQNEKRYNENTQRISAHENSIAELKTSIVGLPDLEKKHDSLRDMRVKIEQNLKKAKKDYNFYSKHDKCPTCDQNLEKEHKTKHLAEAAQREEKLSKGFSDITTTVNDIFTQIKEYQGVQEEITTLQHEITSYGKENSKILKENEKILKDCNKETPDLDVEKKTLVDFETTLSETEKRCAGVRDQENNLKIVSNLLKDGGVKSKIISKFIPIINQKINKYLAQMDFYVDFTLDEEFNEVIRSRFRDVFSYSSFSEGEKQKIDLALLFTWREIAKLKNSASTNLLILDEVFDSSLDGQSTDELLKILKLMDSTQVFVISHKGEILEDKFPRTIRFEKVNDFSKIKETVDE